MKKIIKFNPLSLLTPLRFDINAKIFYAKHRNLNSEYPKELYLEHIRVWNGFFESYPEKNKPEDFINSFNITLESILRFGFKSPEKNYIPLKNNSPYNGSHRVAASIVSDVEIYGMEDDSNGQHICDYRFFKQKGLSDVYLDEMALEYVRNKKNTYTISIFSSDKKDLSLAVETIKKHSNIVYNKEINFTELGKHNYIIELYRFEKWIGNHHSEYGGAKHKMSNCFRNSNKIQLFVVECDNIEKLLLCKKEIRDYYKEENHSVHINDTQEETWRICSTLLNKNSLWVINNVKQPNYDNFISLFSQYRDEIKNQDINKFCITSSSVLSLFSIRECNDIDFITTDVSYVDKKDGNVSSHENQLKYYPYHKDDIIINPNLHFYFMGYKFTTLDVLKKMKESRGEQKDKNDVLLINDFTIKNKK
jgi:hypothetical protein